MHRGNKTLATLNGTMLCIAHVKFSVRGHGNKFLHLERAGGRLERNQWWTSYKLQPIQHLTELNWLIVFSAYMPKNDSSILKCNVWTRPNKKKENLYLYSEHAIVYLYTIKTSIYQIIKWLFHLVFVHSSSVFRLF